MGQRHVCYMEDGSIVNGYTGNIIEDPAIFVSAGTDTLHGWGNMDACSAKFEQYVEKYEKAGFFTEAQDLVLIELSKYRIDRESACYVIRRAAEFTQTGFIKNLCAKMRQDDLPSWIEAEMARIPIDIMEKEWA